LFWGKKSYHHIFTMVARYSYFILLPQHLT
jgi:hypothetical protein